MQNHVITNFGRKITLNSEEEDVAINSGIASDEVTTYFRALGKGWQTHMNEVLREYVSKHPV